MDVGVKLPSSGRFVDDLYYIAWLAPINGEPERAEMGAKRPISASYIQFLKTFEDMRLK